MEVLESIGFIHFWGLSPPVNAIDYEYPDDTINILLAGTSDIRHIMKTVADNCRKDKKINLNFYIYEKQKESFCRMLLLLEIIHQANLNYRERCELFLDLFGNCLIREKTQRYIDCEIPNLLNLVSDDIDKAHTPLKKIVLLSEVKFKERDEMTDIIKSWSSKVAFTMEKHRDQRMRYHYKERYDYRKNLVDWDYQMGLKDQASIIHFYHYREWRQTGIAFESRFSSYIQPNRTMGSYLPGKKKLTYESCLVRGYWGDIIISPYIAFGIECDYQPEKEKLFKIANKQHVGHSVEVSEYIIQYFIQMLSTYTEYHIIFTDPYRKDDNKKDSQQNEKETKQQNDDNNKKVQQKGKKAINQTDIKQLTSEQQVIKEENEDLENEEENDSKKDLPVQDQKGNSDQKQLNSNEQETQSKVQDNQNIQNEEVKQNQDKEQIKQLDEQQQIQKQVNVKENGNDDNQSIDTKSTATEVSQPNEIEKTNQEITQIKEQGNINMNQIQNQQEQSELNTQELEKIKQQQQEIQKKQAEEEEIQQDKQLDQKNKEQLQKQKEEEEEQKEQELMKAQKKAAEALAEQKMREKRNAEEAQDYFIDFEHQLLPAFEKMNVKVIPIFEDLNKLAQKKKYQGFFHVGIVGFIQSGLFKEKDFAKLFKNQGTVFAEAADYIVPLKMQERIDLKKNLQEFAKQLNFQSTDFPKPHHLRFVVKN